MSFKQFSEYFGYKTSSRNLEGELFIVLIIFLNLSIYSLAHGQTNSSAPAKNDSYSVRWVGVFPSNENKKNTGFKDKVANVIFGKKEIVLSKPFAIFGTSPDKFWIIDQGLGTLIKVSDGKSEIPVALKKENRQYPSLTGISPFQGNMLLFTDSRLNRIFVLSSDRKKVNVLNDSLKLEQPTGIAWSGINQEIWVVETRAHRISILNSKGELIRRIGRRGAGPGEFNYPTFIWMDHLGNVYIIDSMNFRLQIFDKDGEFITSVGEIGDASGYFARPKGVATDSYGHIFVVDALSHVVQVYDIDGNFLYYFGSQGHNIEQFWMPAGIYIDENDYIYVADTYNSRVQIFQLVDGK